MLDGESGAQRKRFAPFACWAFIHISRASSSRDPSPPSDIYCLKIRNCSYALTSALGNANPMHCVNSVRQSSSHS